MANKLLTSAVVSNVRFGAQTAAELVTDGISGTVVVLAASYNTHALGLRVRVGDGSRGTLAMVTANSVHANSVHTACVRSAALVNICAHKENF